ncbi:MAG: peptidoglycan-associated lipoprotein Pal [Pseudomonadota bacterium]|nr:peptidoglycan-associated lipoprotein Pal [Pseudomonadota bacterium]
MSPLLRAVALSTALLLAVACAKKAPKDLPPPPPAGSGSQQDGSYDPGSVGTTALDRLRSDFVARAGSDTVYFNTDSSSLDAASRSTLEAQAAWLLQHPAVTVTVEGHCDERGTREYNLALGERRANAAKNYLAARGVPASRMRTLSWGKERPLAPGSDERSWAQNRRAVTVLLAGQ